MEKLTLGLGQQARCRFPSGRSDLHLKADGRVENDILGQRLEAGFFKDVHSPDFAETLDQETQ